MSKEHVAQFVNRVDDPAGEQWTIRIRRKNDEVTLEVGESPEHSLPFVFRSETALAFAEYLRAAGVQRDAVHRSVDSRNGEEIYVRIDRPENGPWRIFLSRKGGDVELFVDDSTMERLVETIASALEGGSRAQ